MRNFYSKSKKLLQLNSILFLVPITAAGFSSILQIKGVILEFIIGIPLLALFVSAPLGIYNVIRSLLSKEDGRYKLLHLIFHLFPLLVVFSLLGITIKDILHVF